MTRLLGISVLAAALALAPALAPAADLPPVVVQIQPVGKVLADVKTAARMVAGDPAAKQIDDFLQQQLGDKGFEGLDLTRPILVAYPVLKDVEKLDDPTQMVLIVPVTGEQEFIDFLRRAKSTVEPVEGKKGLYKVVSPKMDAGAKPKGPSYLRFYDGYAYAGEVPADQLDPQNLVPADKLVIPGEQGLVTLRVYFDRLPEDVRKKVGERIDLEIKILKNVPAFDEADALKKKAADLAQKMAARYLTQAKEAKDGTFRLRFDTASGEVSLEFALSGREGTSLAKDVRDRKPTTNRFAALVGDDTAAALLWSFPILKTEFGEILALGFEEGATKELDKQDEKLRPLLKELVAGAVRTVRSGELDVALVASGPDKDGPLGVVAGVSFGDTSKLEKELRTLFEKAAPPQAKEMVKLDAAKVSGVSVHVVTPPAGALPPEAAKAFGDGAKVGVAFAPKGVLVAFGPDPVAALKPVIGAGPKPARVFDLAVNPSRVRKLIAAAQGEEKAAAAEKVLGAAEGLFSVLFLGVEGGDELRVRLGFNLKLLGPAAARGASLAGGGPPTPAAAQEK